MEFSLAATIREDLGKQKVIKLRQKGEVPAVMYGEGKETQHLTLNGHEVHMLFLKGGSTKLINLKVKKGKKEEQDHVLIKEFQRHPVKGNVIHMDFLRVAMDHLVTVKVPVHLEEKKTKDGGILELVLHELEVSCLPASIPNRIHLDVSNLTIGSGLHVKDIALPEGVTAVNSPDETVVLAASPTLAAEAAAETEAAETATEAKEA